MSDGCLNLSLKAVDSRNFTDCIIIDFSKYKELAIKSIMIINIIVENQSTLSFKQVLKQVFYTLNNVKVVILVENTVENVKNPLF